MRDRQATEGERIRYSPSILPRYARRSKSLEVLIPILYLKGISTGDFEEALAALVGTDAPGLSASTIARLKEAWSQEHARWQKRDLSAKRYLYFWVDGIHLEARLEEQAQCILVIIGATPEGRKELVGFTDGIRESSQSWRDLLLDLKRRGLTTAPQIAVADGALGFWKALGEVWPTTREQRCWVHKTANILNKLPKRLHTKAKRALQEIWMAETKKDAVAALECRLFGILFRMLAVLCTQQRCSRVVGHTSPSAFQNPSAPPAFARAGLATAICGPVVKPRRLTSSSRSRHDCELSRMPSVNPTSSFLPSGVAPMMTRMHCACSSSRASKWMASAHM